MNSVSPALIARRALALVAFALVTLLCAAYAIAMPAQAYAADADGNVGRTRFVEGETGTYWKSWSDLFQNIKDTGKQTDSDTVIFDIYGDFDTSSLGMIEVPAGKTFTFNLHGHMINRGLTNASSVNSGKGNGEVFCVKGKLIVNGGDTSDGGSIAHNGNLSENGRFWKYDGSGTAPINGGLITGGACDDADSAGGIYVANGGASVELNDVTVAGNVGASYSLAYGATTRAGGISLYKSSCSLKMSNSKVLYNYSASNGGGINVSGSSCKVEITSGSQVSSNTTGDKQYAWGGGGIYFNGSGSSLVISGGSKVDNNYTPNNGGGIYHNFSNGTIEVKGSSEVCDNVAGGNGGGIYDCYDGTTINISGSKVDGNFAVNGGGVFLEDAATLNITNEGSVSGNKAAGGAGIYINDEGTSVYVKNNSTVSNNEATGNGGGIYHNDKTGVVSFDSSTLSGNKAGGNGGGVYNGYGEGNSYSFANGSSVSGNEANNGGGLFSIKEVYVYVKTNSSICNNIAKNDGGGIYCTSEPLNLTFTDNGSMHGNTAGADGGAICSVTSLYVVGPDYNTRVWYNDYKTIYGNKASKGAGIWFAGDARLSDVVVTDNLASSIGGGVYCDNDTDEAFCFNNTVVVKDNKMGADSTSLQSNVVIKGTQLLHGYDKLDTDAYPSASTCVYVTVEDYVNGSRILCDERFTKNFDKESSSCTNVVADDTSCCKIVFNEDGTLSNELADGEVTSLDVTLTINFGNSQSVTIKTYKYAFLKIKLADYAKNGYAPDYFTTSWNDSKLEPWKSDSNYTGVQMPTKADSYAITAHYPRYKVNVTGFSTINNVEAGSTVSLASNSYKKDGLEPTYWTIEDAAGNMQILWPKDGAASFAMLGSDVNATPHYPVALSGVDVTLSESSTWDGLSVGTQTAPVAGTCINSVSIATDSASYVLTADELKDVTIVSREVQTQSSGYTKATSYTVQIPSSVFAAYNITLPAADVSLVASGAVYAQNVDKYTYEGKTCSSYGAAVATDGEVSHVKFTATEYYTQPVAEAVCVTTNCVNANDTSTTLATSSDYCTKDQSVSVTPPTKTGWKFAGWVGDKPAGATEDATTHALTFTPSSAITLTASYIPLVSAVDISVDALVADGSFPAQAKAANARDNAGTKLAVGTSSIVWTRTDGSTLDAKPAKDASYNATLKLGLSAGSDQDATAYQWAFADTVSVTLNGTPVVADKVKVSGSQQLEVSYTETPATGTDDRIFTVSFDAGDIAEDPATQNVKKGSTAKEPDALVTESKKVSGWYTDTACTQLYDFSAPVESNITLYAKWVDRTYTVTFDSHGGSAVEPQVVAYGKTATKPVDPTKSGYVFSGWQSSNGAYSFSTPVTGDITLKASWQQEHAQGDWCKVTFDAAGGSEVEAQLVAGGSKVTRPADPTKEGYVFNGWALDGELFDFDKPVMQSITLVAVWEKQSADLIDISPAQVTLGKARLAYNGKVQTSSVANVVLSGKELAAGQDYIASIGGGKLVGTYKVTVTGVGSYTGSVTAAYDIVPAKVKGLKAKVVGKGKLKLAWTKNALQRDGVQVRYAVSKAKLKAGKGKAVKVKGAGAKAKTFKKLKNGKRYYFKVRAYKVVNGKIYWSGWSKVKSAKAK